MNLLEFQNWFNPYFNGYVEELSEHAKAEVPWPELWRHLQLFLGGGKRVRPYLIDLLYRSCGGQERSELLPYLYAVELFHAFCLVHDDIIDQSSLRHRVATMHTYLRTFYAEEKRLGDATHIGQSQAILVGDLLFSWSKSALDKGLSEPVKKYEAGFFEEVIYGQMLDVDTMTRPWVDEAAIIRKTYLKTARYSFVYPLYFGAAVAGEDEKRASQIEKLGTALGMAFQIQDDLLDVLGSQEEVEKGVGGDVRYRQHTFLTNYVLQKGTAREQEKLQRLWGKEASGQAAQQLFQDSGALIAAQGEVERYYQEAKEIIESMHFSPEPKAEWFTFITLLSQRKK